MTILESGLPLKDVACIDPYWGEYYNLYWHAFKIWDLAQVDQHYIGKSPIDTEQAFVQADKTLAEASKHDHRYLGYRHVPAAASIIRMCMRHDKDGPTLEVAQNAIYVSDQPRFTVRSSAHSDVHAGSHPHHGGAPIGYGKELRYNFEGREVDPINLTPFHYMPRADYSGFKRGHEGVWSAAGADSAQLRFGLLGGEVIMPVPSAVEAA